jgi:hypothetical protein
MINRLARDGPASGRQDVRLLAAILALAASGCASMTLHAASCDRACLYGALDQYLTAFAAKDPSKAPLAANVRYTENNVALEVGDGVWATLASLGKYDFRFADPQTGGVGFYGVLTEAKTAAPYTPRLKVKNRQITEIETIIARPQDSLVPFTTAEITDNPLLNEILPPDQRTPRSRMIELADGYFNTLQQNNGAIHTVFDPKCNRRENGFQTTNNTGPGASPTMRLGCEEAFKLGYYLFDDRLRSRRFEVVDEERGLVMAAAFIDHAGIIGDYKLTDGRTVTAGYRRPHTWCLIETFKIKSGRIEQIEAVFVYVPYRMPSPWMNSKWVKGGFEYE